MKNHDDGAHSLKKKLHSSNSSALSHSAPYPRVPDLESRPEQYENTFQDHQDCYHHPPQSQYSSDYYYNNNQYPPPYHQRDGTEYIKLGKDTPAARTDWEDQRSADSFRKQNDYTNYSKMDETSTTNDPRNGAAEPLLQQQNGHHPQLISHGRSFSDQSLRRSSASETNANRKGLIHPTPSVDPPRSFHRRAASDLSFLKNRKRRSISSSSSDHHTQDSEAFENKDGQLPQRNKIINANRYKCNECFKTFSRPSSLRIHILSHTGEKPHICPQPSCGRRFSVQSNMRRHLKVHYCSSPPQQRQQQQQQTFSSRLQQS
ncbi:hypothetical protein INT46_010358 [Mucor plumbeus]|uniref:C2H2-type domain-containing protein n=1 Tax=Mucor plumbeus TaxID=97098 RepID=A0A8H7RBP6_9FUNG|nr:hypothetical protein INT46_010358 [Mucor plumbeus]